MQKRIAVSGSTGFVGSYLINYLQNNGFDVMPINLRNKDWSTDFPTDLYAIIHLAGKAHDLKKTSDDEAYFHVNTQLTKEIYDVFLNSNIPIFMFMSSVKAAADQLHDASLTEDFKPNPQTAYGQSKREAEKYIEANQNPEKSSYIFRPCMIHGPGNKGNLNLLYQFVAKGLPYPLGAFENKRSFLGVENLSFCIKEILMKNIPSGIYNLADDVPLSTNEVIFEMQKTLGKKQKIWKLSPQFIHFIAKIGDRLRLPLNSERLVKLTENFVISNQKITKAIGKKLPNTTRESLAITIKSF